jgi:hypothetical protein
MHALEHPTAAACAQKGTGGDIDLYFIHFVSFHRCRLHFASFIHQDLVDETGNRAGECRRRGCETCRYASIHNGRSGR